MMNMAASTQRHYPVGMKFHPSDFEIIDYFLHNKAEVDKMGIYSNLIHECEDLYGEKEPWVIWDMYGGSRYEQGEEAIYFYTKRIKMNSSGRRFTRKVGSGTWSGEYSHDILGMDGATVIGTRRNFRYEKGSDSDQNGAWFMHEYESKEKKNSRDTYVICSLRRNPRKIPPTKVPRKRKRSDDVVDDQQGKLKKDKSHKTQDFESNYEVVYHDVGRQIKQEKVRENTSYDAQGSDSCAAYKVYHDVGQPIKQEKVRENTSYDAQGSDTCAQRQPQGSDVVCAQGSLPSDHKELYFPFYDNNYFGDVDDSFGISLDDINAAINSDDSVRVEPPTRFHDQLYQGNNSFINYQGNNGFMSNSLDYSNGGVSHLPNGHQRIIDFLNIV